MALLDDLDASQLDAVFAELEGVATDSVRRQGVAPSDVVVERRLELRYLGQEHALPVVVGSVIELAELRKAFEELHVARYGHAMDNRLQVLNVRVRAIGRAARPILPELPPGDGDPSRARTGSRPAFDFGTRSTVDFAVYERARLAPGDVLHGPVLVDEGTSTTVVISGQQVAVEAHGYLLVTEEA